MKIMNMKKIFLAGSVLLLSVMSSEASNKEQVDTLANVTDVTKLVITESATGVSVKTAHDEAGDSLTEILSRSLDGDVVVSQRRWSAPIMGERHKKIQRWDVFVGGPSIGWVNAVGAPNDVDIEMGKSLEISWLSMFGVLYRPNRYSELTISFGIDWRNYRISTSKTRFLPNQSGGVDVAPYPAGVIGKGSRLKVFGMGIPVMWKQYMPLRGLDGSRMSISAGVVLNYNSHGSLLTKWIDEEGRKAEQKSNHIGHRRFTFDLMAAISPGWDLNLYVRYCPQTVLRGAGQPEFRSFSTGIGYMF